MQEVKNWRELLGRIIHDPHERQRLADELGIRPITLIRWVNGESIPRSQNLRHLISIFPHQYRKQFLEMVGLEFRDFPLIPYDEHTPGLSATFYDRVLAKNASSTDTHRSWDICSLILQDAIEVLDPDEQGLMLTVARCTPPSDEHKVRSLREYVGIGTLPWSTALEQKALFLGAESLAGYAVGHGRDFKIQSLTEGRSMLPYHRVEYEESAAAYPIVRSGKIAGCFLVSSVQTDNFLQQERLSLIQAYTNLLVLAFDPHEFYVPQDIALRIMPVSQEQQPYFVNFQQKVSQLMIRASNGPQPLSHNLAEEAVWKQIEEDMLSHPPRDM